MVVMQKKDRRDYPMNVLPLRMRFVLGNVHKRFVVIQVIQSREVGFQEFRIERDSEVFLPFVVVVGVKSKSITSRLIQPLICGLFRRVWLRFWFLV